MPDSKPVSGHPSASGGDWEQSEEPGLRWSDLRPYRGSFFNWDAHSASTGHRSPASRSAGNAGSLPAARSRSGSVGRALPSEDRTVGPSPMRKLSADFERAAGDAALSRAVSAASCFSPRVARSRSSPQLSPAGDAHERDDAQSTLVGDSGTVFDLAQPPSPACGGLLWALTEDGPLWGSVEERELLLVCGMLNPGSSTPEGDPATASPRRGAGEELRAGRSGGYGSLEVGAAGAGGASPHRGASEVQPAGLSGERGVLEDGAAGAGEARLRRGATDEQPAGCSGGAGPWRRSGWCWCGRGARRAARAAGRRSPPTAAPGSRAEGAAAAAKQSSDNELEVHTSFCMCFLLIATACC